jgi:hypothetical protein
LLIKGIGIEQAISFLTANCVKLQPRDGDGDRINAVRAKPKEVIGRRSATIVAELDIQPSTTTGSEQQQKNSAIFSQMLVQC